MSRLGRLGYLGHVVYIEEDLDIVTKLLELSATVKPGPAYAERRCHRFFPLGD
jgi:hypothetical protein